MKAVNLMAKIMMVIGGVGALVTVLLRVWIMPGMIDSNTGVLDSRWPVMAFMLVCLLALVVLAFLVGGTRREMTGGSSVALSAAMLAMGVVLAVGEGDTFVTALQEQATGEIIQGLLGVLSAVALVVLALRMLSEGGTRRGISQWSMLLPVLWMWMRLVNYEMSYSSLARLEDSFFGFAMLIFELLFLFKLARYTTGVGGTRTGSLLFYSAATVLFALSAAIVKVILYVMDDGLAVTAYDLAGAADFAVGVLALAVGIAQLWGKEPVEPEESMDLEDASADELLFPEEDEAPAEDTAE